MRIFGMTQTQPEPSMFVKIKVDDNDVVVGYLIVVAFVDDVRMFGTEPELQDYKAKISSCMKVKFENCQFRNLWVFKPIRILRKEFVS
jgi:hypothetical protein